MGSPNLTQEGTILGTFQYMAPEQLEGKEADARTDTWALGCVLYEMVTGKKAFSASSQASLIGAILHTQPAPISSIEPMTPPVLDHLVRKCLAKDPEDRWQSTHDVASELKWIAEGSQAGVPSAIRSRRHTRERLAWTLVATLSLAALGLGLALARRRSPIPVAVRFSVAAPEKTSFGTALALSPDGRRLVFEIVTPDGRSFLWLRAINSLSPQRLEGTEGGRFPFWSPDSRFIGFFADRKLKKIDVSGGPPQMLCDVGAEARGGTWNREGVIVFSPNIRVPLQRVSAAGGVPADLTTLDSSKGEYTHRWPRFLPDGRHFLYLALGAKREHNGIYVGSLESKDKRLVLVGDSGFDYGPPGYLLFVREKTLMAQRFDTSKLQVSGDPLPVAPDVPRGGENAPTGYAPLSLSDTGVLAYRSVAELKNLLTWLDRNGKRLGVMGQQANHSEPWLFPDGNRVALAIEDPTTGTQDLWLLEISRGTLSRLTFDGAGNSAVVCSPDGTRIAYSSRRSGHADLYERLSSGAGDERLLLQTSEGKFSDCWTADGRYIVFDKIDPKSNFDVWILPLAGDRKPLPILHGQFNESHSQVSPDGRWIAYSSDETGRSEIYVQSFPSPGGKWQVSTDGGDQASWRADGKELFYLSAGKKLMAVDVKAAGSSFEAGVARLLFETSLPPNGIADFRNQYVATADGQRFLVTALADEAPSSPINVVVHWGMDLPK
jgi:Tol biopolymer transport system component